MMKVASEGREANRAYSAPSAVSAVKSLIHTE